jgi:hypothetical protein
MVIPLPCTLSFFSSTWSSCPSFYVHSFIILLIILCTKTCGLVAISLCHLLLYHVCCLCLLQTTWHNGISNSVSLITKTKLGISISLFLVIDDNHHKDMKWNQFSILIVLAPPTYVLPWVWFNCAHMYGFEFWESYYYQIDAKVYRMDLWSVIPIRVAFIYHP